MKHRLDSSTGEGREDVPRHSGTWDKSLPSSSLNTTDLVADGKFCYRIYPENIVHYLTKFSIWIVIKIIGFILFKKGWSRPQPTRVIL